MSNRRKLVALATLAAAGHAGAQVASTGQGPVTSSSATLFGVVDAAIAWGDGSDASNIRLVSGANTASRLGVRVFEDLGGGLAAGAWLEIGFNTDDGTGTASNQNNQPVTGFPVRSGTQGLMFNRRSTVSLMGDWGEVRVGRDFVATYRNRDQVDPFATNGVGANQANVGTIAGVTSTRASNMVGYFLPAARLGGFFGEAQAFLGENADNVPNDNDGNGFQGRLGFATDFWGIAGAWGITKYASTATTGDINAWNIGAHFRFGSFLLTGGWFQDEVEQTGGDLTGKGFLIGGRMPFGALELKVAYSQYETDAAGDPKTAKIAIGGVYNLSKRTAAYATYAHVDNRGSAATALNASVTAAGRNSDGIDIGLKHSF
jgi:predicted porin